MAKEASTGAYPVSDQQPATVPQQRAEAAARFCGNCGVAASNTRFCPSCGTPIAGVPVDATPATQPLMRVADETSATQPFVPVQQAWRPAPDAAESDPDAKSGRQTLIVLGAIIGCLAVLGAVLVVLLRGSHDTYPAAAKAAVQPVVADNAVLATTMSSLKASASSAAAEADVTRAVGDLHAAQSTLSALQPQGSKDRATGDRLRAALNAESTWLAAVQAVLGDPRSAEVSQLSALGEQAANQLTAAAVDLPALGTRLVSSTQLVAWAQAQVSAASAAKAERAFSGRVMDLLNQSTDGYTKINELFSQLTSAADGFGASITLAQAEQTISTVIANREALAGSARALDAPTALTVKVRSALAAAISASLTDDQQINDCLNQSNDGTVAFIFQSCLNSTQSANSSATAAKDRFYAAYNQLRRQLGQPSSHIPF